MSEARNYEEYRAGVLESLGEDYTVEDLRNEGRWRAKVLDALGVEHDAYDTSYFERYRLKVLEGLAGGVGGLKLIASEEFEVNTTSTSETTVGTISAGAEAWDSSKLVVVSIRDKAGMREGYFIGSDTFIANPYQAAGSSATTVSIMRTLVYVRTSTGFSMPTSNMGIYASSLKKSNGDITIKAKYNSSSSGTINGTYKCDVYVMDFPGGMSPLVHLE